MQLPWVRLARIRIVAEDAGEFLAGEHHGAGLDAGAFGDGPLQLGRQLGGQLGLQLNDQPRGGPVAAWPSEVTTPRSSAIATRLPSRLLTPRSSTT